ncbi:MAG: hypothetical protein A3K19_23745 [Lentisphaerae bacterium RIFOXYB12_FULL_65_16]|nr:MAG: hypothetical protein A3K18_16620 [Lentisphaerae bacterium RIFOXYA12_64_32]OGV89450.1 MAG: hypothetical protein A3K19_23745 [Lentisphaerae bacterium RIFOXYB12_FULL_65_16]
MKKFGLTVAFLMVVMLVTAAGFTLALGRTCPRNAVKADATAQPVRVEDAAWLTRTLNLTPEQQTAVQALEAEYRQALTGQCAAHCTARAGMREVLFAPDPDGAKTRSLLDTMGQAQRANELAMIEHIRKVHKLLTPDQQRVYENAVTECLCTECPTGMHECGTQNEARPKAGASTRHGK